MNPVEIMAAAISGEMPVERNTDPDEAAASFAHAALTALAAQGYAVVPVEPDSKMIEAGELWLPIEAEPLCYAIYRAMIAAARPNGEA